MRLAPLLAVALLAGADPRLIAADSPASDCDTLVATGAARVLSDLEAALVRLEECSGAARRRGDSAREAESLRLVAELHGMAGRWRKSLGAAERAAAAAREAGDPEREAWGLLAQGDALYYLWRFDEAARVFGEALALFREAGDAVGEAHALKNLGISQVPLGRRDLALLHLEAAMERYPQWRDDELAVSILGNLGTIYARLGAPLSARRTFERALAIARQRGRPGEIADLLGRLGDLYLGLGRARDARRLFEEAVAEASEAGPAAVLPLLEGSAWALAQTGDRAAARARLERLVEALRADRNRIGTCLALTDLAWLLEGEDPEGAAARYREAGGLAGTVSLPCRWESEAGLARLARREGDLATAIEALGRALAAVEQRRAELVADHDRRALAARTDALYRDLAEAAIERAGVRGFASDLDLAFHALERMRAASLQAMIEARLADVEAPAGREGAYLRRLEDEIARLRSRVEAGEPGDRETARLRERLERRQMEADEHRRNRRRVRADVPPPAALTAAQVRARLPGDAALVSYLLGEESSFAFVLTRDELRLVELPTTAARVTEQVGGFLELLEDSRHSGWAAVGRRLHRDLVEPWMSRLDPRTALLVVVPDRALRSLPFESLPLDAGADRLFVEEVAVAYSPSATALFDLVEAPTTTDDRQAQGDADVLILAEPLIADGERTAHRPLRALYEEDGHDLAPVPFGGVEAARIARYARRARTLARGDATEARLKAMDLARFRVLHLATHALLSARDPRRSALYLGLDEDGVEDGFLQAREIERLRLDAELVVLSACRTARGEPAAGGVGIESLAEAFFLAGARSVVGTLWDVEDRAAMSLSTSFYRQLAAGLGKAEALRRAKLEAVAGGAPPAAWAGFVLIGEPFAGVSVVEPRRRLATPLAAIALMAVALAAGAVWKVRRDQEAL